MFIVFCVLDLGKVFRSVIFIFLVSDKTGDALPSLVSTKWDKTSLNCFDHKLAQLLANFPVAAPSTCCIFPEFLADSEMSDVLLVLSSHGSTGPFILAIDSQYNVPNEIIATWNLREDLPQTICMTVVLKFQQGSSFCRVCFSWAPQNPMLMLYALLRCQSNFSYKFYYKYWGTYNYCITYEKVPQDDCLYQRCPERSRSISAQI